MTTVSAGEELGPTEHALLRPWLTGRDEQEAAVFLDALARYLELLHRWSRAYDLVGPNEFGRLVARHVLPSLALATHLNPRASLLDVGSGAGFPGLVIALRDPTRRVVLVERNGKKARFLDHVARRLNLEHLRVVHDDVRRFQEGPFDVVTARAWGSARDLLAASDHLAHEATVWYLLKGRRGRTEVDALSPSWRPAFAPLFPAAFGRREDFLLTVVRSNPSPSTGRST